MLRILEMQPFFLKSLIFLDLERGGGEKRHPEQRTNTSMLSKFYNPRNMHYEFMILFIANFIFITDKRWQRYTHVHSYLSNLSFLRNALFYLIQTKCTSSDAPKQSRDDDMQKN